MDRFGYANWITNAIRKGSSGGSGREDEEMEILKRKQEPNKTLIIRVPASVKARLEASRKAADEAGYDVSATPAADVTDEGRRSDFIGRGGWGLGGGGRERRRV